MLGHRPLIPPNSTHQYPALCPHLEMACNPPPPTFLNDQCDMGMWVLKMGGHAPLRKAGTLRRRARLSRPGPCWCRWSRQAFLEMYWKNQAGLT